MDIFLKYNYEEDQQGQGTIERHKNIADEKGYVWWGKFGKGIAQSKVDIIKQQLEMNVPTVAYLYTRTAPSGELFYKATVLDVVGGITKKNHYSMADEEHVPEYYRGIKQGAWFKLSNFQKLSLGYLRQLPISKAAMAAIQYISKSKTLVPEKFGLPQVTAGNLLREKAKKEEKTMPKETTEKYFCGDLVQNKELNRIAKQRKKEYKKKVKLRKDKECGELLEDEVWLLFHNMGFIEMNKDRNFEIQAGPIRKQIDVFTRDENNVFIIECKARSKEGPKSLRKDIHEILHLRKDIIKSIKKKYGKKFRVSFLLVTRNIVWSSTDERLAIANRKNRFFFWKEAELEAYTNLTDQLGKSAKFQLYAILFRGQRIYELGDIEVPAIYGGRGKAKYYSFIIHPDKLLQIAYVSRRERSNPEEVSETYQRMVKKSRLDKICKFIDKGGFFPNNIILNFTEEPIFEKKAKAGDISYGILKFPKYYGSAWIIDGQHRLYGYSESKKKTTETVPVVAFVSLKPKRQAELFVDINREQKAVTSNLLWDLYPDIYQNVDDEKYQILRAISLAVKKLNSELDSPLHKHIYIPSVPRGGKDSEGREITNLTMANICDGLKDNKLINEKEGLLYEKDYDHAVDFASERIKAYFNVIAKSFSQDWKEGDDGLLRTNIGIRIFLIILRQLLRYLKYEGKAKEKTYRKKDLNEFKNEIEEVIKPALTRLKKMSVTERSKIRGETGKGRVMNNAQQMAWWIKEKFDAFGLEILHDWSPPVPPEETDEGIRKLLKDTETELRFFIVEELKKVHGRLWWRQGIPGGVKNHVKNNIDEKLRNKELASYPSMERRLDFSATPHLREIILRVNNWKHFETTFIKDKEWVRAQFKSFENIRDPYQHYSEHELDEITKKLGYWGMKWIRKCIGLNKARK